jgi:hypothetical protein
VTSGYTSFRVLLSSRFTVIGLFSSSSFFLPSSHTPVMHNLICVGCGETIAADVTSTQIRGFIRVDDCLRLDALPTRTSADGVKMLKCSCGITVGCRIQGGDGVLHSLEHLRDLEGNVNEMHTLIFPGIDC